MALHAVELLHGMGTSGETKTYYQMTTDFKCPAPLPRGYRDYLPVLNIEEGAIAR